MTEEQERRQRANRCDQKCRRINTPGSSDIIQHADRTFHGRRATTMSSYMTLLLLFPSGFLVQSFQPRQYRHDRIHQRLYRPWSGWHPLLVASPKTTILETLESLVQPATDAKSSDSLPIYDLLEDLRQATTRYSNVLLEAPPGAGKTTVVPLAMLQKFLQKDNAKNDQQIWVVEPRRVAARSAATRMAALVGERLGESVGYVIRGERRTNSQTTQITVVTDGILLQRLRSDPELTNIAMVIFDEFHERGVDSDVALALCRETQRLLRDATTENPLQMIVMSATLLGETTAEDSAAAKLVQALGGTDECQVLQSDGRQYPIQILHAKDLQWKTRPPPLGVLMKDRKALVNVMCDAIEQGILRAPAKGDVLAFLPGAAEIRRTVTELRERGKIPKDVEIVPLYGALPKDRQDYALFPPKNSPRRVIVSSPIAEASLTLERVTCVVDSGLRREPRCDVDTNMPRLVTSRSSKASATQRAGRAGRVQEGLCLRIFGESEFQDVFPEHAAPGIISTDLSATVLLLADWGCSTTREILEEMPFVDAPPSDSLNGAIQLLVDLKAIERTGDRIAITTQGRVIAKIPTHPRFATAINRAADESPIHLASAVAATFLLDDEVGLRTQAGPDLASRVFDLYRNQSVPSTRALLQYAARISKEAKEAVQDGLDGKTSAEDIKRTVGQSLLPGFADLVSERKGDASYGGSMYLLSLGRSARLDDIRDAPEYVVVLDTSTSDDGKTRIRAFVPIDKSALFEASVKKEVLFTVPSKGHEVRARMVRVVGSLELESTPLPSPSADKMTEVLIDTIQNLGGVHAALIQTLPPDKRKVIDELCSRVDLRSQLVDDHDDYWPACFSALSSGAQSCSTKEDDVILKDLLEPWLAGAGSLKKIDLYVVLFNSLTPDQQQQLDSEFPAKIEAPDGTQIPISYSTNPPSAIAKLQQFFGTTQTPSVGPAGKSIALSLSLTSPAGKLVAQTVDLPFFWKETYPSVRAELRGRYAKHPWPEDPMTATATRQTKKQLACTDETEEQMTGGKKKRKKKR